MGEIIGHSGDDLRFPPPNNPQKVKPLRRRTCAGTKRTTGTPCTHEELPGFGYCFRHLPEDLIAKAAEAGHERCGKMLDAGDGTLRHCSERAIGNTGRCGVHPKTGQWLVPVGWEQRRKVARIHTVAAEAGIDTTKVANPLQALLELCAEALAFKEELKRRVVALDENEWRYEHIAGEQIRGDIILYERAMDRVAKMLISVTRLGIEERLARVEERQAVLIEQAIVHALEGIGIGLEQQDLARAAVARELRVIE